MKAAGFKAIALYALFFVFLPFTGYAYVKIQGGEQIINKDVRAVAVLALFALVAMIFMMSCRMQRVPCDVLGMGSFFGYGIIVSVMRNSPDVYLSYLVRVGAFIMIFWIAHAWAKTNYGRWLKFMRRVVIGSSLIYVFQSLIDLATLRALAMNGAIRFPGSVGSPPGYASICMLFLLANAYLLMITRARLHLVLSALLLVCSFLTGTRAIAVLCLLIFAVAFTFHHRSIYVRAGIFIAGMGLAPFLVQWMWTGTDIGSRIALAVQDQANDTSANFRMMILQTYFSRITASELIFGLGIGGFPNWFASQTGIVDVGPHFEFLWALAELGVIGTSIYIAVLCTSAWRVLRLRRTLLSHIDVGFILLLLFAQQLIFQFTNPLYFYQLCVPLLFLLGGMFGGMRTRQ